MKTWANRRFAYGPASNASVPSIADSRPPKGAGKGGKGKRGKGSKGNEFKRQRRNQPPRTEFQAVKELSVNNAALGLQTARNFRLQSGKGSVTILTKEASIATAVLDVDEDPNNPPRTAVQKWAALVQAIAEHPDVPDVNKVIINKHIAEATSEDEMLLVIEECTCFPTFDVASTYKITFSVSSELHPVLVQIIRAYTKLGADIRFGASTRTNLERLTQTSLDIVRSF